MTRTTRDAMAPYVTKDGSEIRELLHPAHHPLRNQSLAEAVVAVGAVTALHRHHRTEELYHITRGHGTMTLGDVQFTVAPGDSIAILPGTPHCIANTGSEPLHLLCCCAPPYSHDDTELLAAPV